MDNMYMWVKLSLFSVTAGQMKARNHQALNIINIPADLKTFYSVDTNRTGFHMSSEPSLIGFNMSNKLKINY